MMVVGEILSARLDAHAAEALMTRGLLELDQPLAPRQCGRCRKLFDGDPTLPAAALPEWWLCPPCRVSLRIDNGTVSPSPC